DTVARQGTGQRSVTRRPAGDDERAGALLAVRLRLAKGGGEAEWLCAIRSPDRRPRRSFHSRSIQTPECGAADYHAWVARLGHRAARGRGPAHRPDRAW